MSNRWVVTSNITHFKEKLAAESDAEKRRVLAELLAKEEKKLREMGLDT